MLKPGENGTACWIDIDWAKLESAPEPMLAETRTHNIETPEAIARREQE